MSGVRILDWRAGEPDPGEVEEVIRHLRDGGLLAYPTETVYGFGCALREEALERLRRLKEREPERPFLLLVPDGESVSELEWTAEARELAEVFWPGALTLVLRDPRGRFPPEVRSPAGTVAVRRTPHPLARRIVEALGEPLTSTSANRPGEAPAASAQAAGEVARAAGAGAGFWVVDGGRLPPSEPSTIVDCTETGAPRVVRSGAVPPGRLGCVLPGPA